MAPRNLMLDFMQGYQFGDNINRADRAEARQTKLDTQNEDTLKRSNHLQDLQLEEHGKKQDAVKAQEAEYHLSQFEKNPDYTIPEETLSWVQSKHPDLFKRPAKEQVDRIDNVMRKISAGGLPEKQEAIEFFNDLYDSQIGEGKRIVDLYPGQNGGIIPELEVVGKDGKPYRAPMTANRGTAEDGDNIVKEIPMQDIFRDVATRRQVLGLLHGIQIKGGIDPQAAEKKLALVEKEAQIKQKYEKQPPVAIGKYGLYDPKSGKTIAGGGGAAGGLGGPGSGKGKWIMGEDGEWEFLSVGQTGKGMGKQHVKQNDDGSTTVYDEATRTSRIIYTPELALQKAKAMAQAEADEVGSQWTSLQPSAEKTNARAKEIYAELMGGATQPPAANNPSPASQFSPGQTIKQGGKTYVVDDSGVPQEQGGNNGATSPRGGLEKPEGNKKSFLNSQSPSLDLGQALGGLTKGGVKVAKSLAGSVPEVGSFVDAATAATAQAMRPEEVVKFLYSKSSEFAKWWTGASKEQREAFIERSAPSSHN